MAADWLKPRALPADLHAARDRLGSPLRVRLAVLVFVLSFAAGTAVPGWEAASFLVGAAAALFGVVLYVLTLRGPDRTSRELNDWLLYRPEPVAPAVEMVMFGLLGLGLAVTIVAAVLRIAVG